MFMHIRTFLKMYLFELELMSTALNIHGDGKSLNFHLKYLFMNILTLWWNNNTYQVWTIILGALYQYEKGGQINYPHIFLKDSKLHLIYH